MKINVNNPCFVCGSTASLLLFECEYPERGYPGKFAMRQCDRCGLLFNSPRLNDNELNKLYSANYYFFQRNDADEFRRVCDIYLRTVSLIDPPIIEKNIIEIGSAKGYLLALLKRLDWRVQGIEISSAAAQYSIHKFSIPTYNGTVEDYCQEIKGENYSAVLAIDVIEHVPNPQLFLNSLDHLVCENGILILDTPNGNAENIQTLGSGWKGFNPFHIYIFPPEVLRTLLENMGYSIERCFSYGNRCEYVSDTGRKNEPRIKESAKSILRRLGMFDVAKTIYKYVRRTISPNDNDVDALISEWSERAIISPNYFATADARGDLAKEIKGDNIVIFARKNRKRVEH